MLDVILKALPVEIGKYIVNVEGLTEVRLRCGTNCILRKGQEEVETKYIVDQSTIKSILRSVSENSIYAVQREINQGFLTIKGGHRIGITGEVIMDGEKIVNVKNISSLNIRIASEIKSDGKDILDKIINVGKFESTLILSPPGCGKTTLLRNIIRTLSNYKYNIGIIDERGEIASMYDGAPNLDVGKRTDIISFCTKAEGINMLVRSMSPDIIATDEIGSKEDIKAIEEASIRGVKLLVTMHGDNIEDIKNNKELMKLIESEKIHTICILDFKDGKPGNIKEIYTNIGKIKYNESLIEGSYVI